VVRKHVSKKYENNIFIVFKNRKRLSLDSLFL
jgi:hypothetical protein